MAMKNGLHRLRRSLGDVLRTSWVPDIDHFLRDKAQLRRLFQQHVLVSSSRDMTPVFFK